MNENLKAKITINYSKTRKSKRKPNKIYEALCNIKRIVQQLCYFICFYVEIFTGNIFIPFLVPTGNVYLQNLIICWYFTNSFVNLLNLPCRKNRLQYSNLITVSLCYIREAQYASHGAFLQSGNQICTCDAKEKSC